MGNVNSKYICDACKRGDCKNCESSITCDCECNIGGVTDVTQKVATTVGGVATAVGGLALTLATGGLAAPIGGALIGAGISSAYQGIEKSIKKERINGLEYCADVGFGAVTGVFTGGIGATGEAIAGQAVKQGAKEVAKTGAKKLAIRAGAGITAGVAAKAIDEVKACSTTDKKWSDYGKAFDKNGECSVGATVTSWVSSAATGAIGGTASHLTSNAAGAVNNGLQKAAVRVAISGGSASASDALSQGLNIATGVQDEYDVKRTVMAGAVSATTTAAMEGTKNAIYAAYGGKQQFLENRTNNKLIEENVPKEDQKLAKNALDDLKKIPKAEMTAEMKKAEEYTEWNKKNGNLKVKKDFLEKNFDKINKQLNLKEKAVNKIKMNDNKDYNKKMAAVHDRKARQLIDRKNDAVSNLNKATNNNVQTVSKNDLNKLGNNNAHALVDGKVGQVAVDVQDSSGRGAKRVIYDVEKKPNGDLSYKYSDYTKDHNYDGTKKYGETDFNKHFEQNKTNLNINSHSKEYVQNTIITNAYDSDDSDD